MLKDEIIKYLKTEYKDLPCLEINTEINGFNMNFNEIDVKAKEFAITNKYIVTFYENTIYIYDRNKLKLDRTIVESIIIFKRKNVSKSVRIFFYKILGVLLENNLSKMYLEGIYNYFDCDELKRIDTYKKGFLLKYKNDDLLYLDFCLNETEPFELEEDNLVSVEDNFLIFNRKDSDFIEKRKFKNIKQFEIINNKIYLLTKK